MALGVAVMIAVIVIYGVTVRQFEQSAHGYHLIVGGNRIESLRDLGVLA